MENQAKKILIVDDDEAFCELVRWSLIEEGFSVEMATSGDEGFGKIRASISEREPFDFAIVDIIMPIMNGIEFGKKVNEKYPDIQIIYTSGTLGLTSVNNYLRLGFDHTLGKPFNTDQLLQIINNPTI